jgi:molybdate transport system substrate-binding protein
MKTRIFIIMASLLFYVLPDANASKSLTVFAPSSLTAFLTPVASSYESTHPGVRIEFSFSASTTLSTQIKSGAPADIFISASPMEMIGIARGKNFVSNRVVLAIPKSSSITKMTDLNQTITWIQCAFEVPCGAATKAALRYENVMSKPVSLEPKVSNVLSKLMAGEVDAAFIYVTDVLANKDKLKAIEFKNMKAASTTYQIARLKKTEIASDFYRYLRSKQVINFLLSKGFKPS